MGSARRTLKARLTVLLWTWLPPCAAALSGALFVGALIGEGRVVGDTGDLVRSLDGVLSCLTAGQFRDCRAARKWALLQYVPALAMRALGISLPTLGLLLSYLNIAAFAGLLLVIWRTLLVRSRLVATAAVLVVASGLLLHYANTSFGEMLAAFVTTSFVASWLQRRRPSLVGTMALVACLSKETALPFVALLGATCVASHRTSGMTWERLLRSESARVMAAGIGMTLGLGLGAVANIVRFGVPYNAAYVHEAAWAPPLPLRAEFFAALWVAPNAGLLFFWPLLVLLLVALPLAVWSRQRREGSATDWVPMGGLGLLLVTLTALLAHWWAPFGWWAWGSRLILPWMPPVLLIGLFRYAEGAEVIVRPLVASPGRAGIVALVVAVAAIPHVSSIFEADHLNRRTFVDRGVCPVPKSPPDFERYYRCIRAQAWEHPSPLLEGYRLVTRRQVRLPAVLFTLLAVATGTRLYHHRQRVTTVETARVLAPPGSATRRRGRQG